MRPFKVYYTDKNDENEDWLLIWVNDVDEAEPYFDKHYPHLKLYDLDDQITTDDVFRDWITYRMDIDWRNPEAVREAFILWGDYAIQKKLETLKSYANEKADHYIKYEGHIRRSFPKSSRIEMKSYKEIFMDGFKSVF